MLCPRCKTELMIESTRLEITGDESPDTETKVYTVQALVCRNPNCMDHGMTVAENRVQMN